MPRQSLAPIPIFNTQTARAGLIILSCVSAYFTYKGASMALAAGLVTWLTKMDAVLFAIGSSTVLYFLWTAAPALAAKVETARERALALILIAVAALMIAGVSSWLNVAGIAGASAIAQHLNGAILSYEAALSERQSALARVKAVIPDFEQAAALYRTRRESEITSGAYTGGPGPGTVEQTLGAIAERFAAQGQTLADQITERQPAMAVAQKTLDTLRATAAGGQDAAIKLQGFARQADALLAALAEADPRPLVESVNRTLAAIPNEARLQGISARTEAGAARQRAALDRIAEEVGETSTALSSALAALTADIGPAPGFARIDPIEAVLRYPLQNAPYWVGGLAMDFAPTLVLIYAMVIMQIRGRPGLFAERVGALTVEDILSADYAKDAIRNGAIDGEIVTRLQNDLSGSPHKIEYKTDEDPQDKPDGGGL